MTMLDHIDDVPDDDELAGAFDADAPEPSPEHIAKLRRQVAQHTRPAPSAAAWTSDPPVRNNSRAVPVSVAAIATVLLVAVLAILPFVNDASAALQHTLKATREAVWIHGATTIERDGRTVTAESWCSPVERVVAFRSPRMLHFVDYASGVQTSYSEKPGKVFRWKADAGTEGFGRRFVLALLNDQDLTSSFPFHDVSEVRKHVVSVDGRPSTQYSFRVQAKDNPDRYWDTTVRTDPDTGRIVLWQDLHSGGMHVTTRFDYPDSGPRDIFELGAPATVEVVELPTPDSELFGK
ncbi:MAG: hypothetical protein ACF8PG_03215 [Maioricimonas sp. JB045]